jgi:hypothetical protein
MEFKTTAESFGVTIVDDTKITVSNSAVYNIQFSAQLTKTDAGTDFV